MIFVPDLCGHKVLKFKNLEEANKLNGYTHKDDTFPTELEALKLMQECYEQDIIYNRNELRKAEAFVRSSENGLKKIKERIKRLERKEKNEKGNQA